MPKRIKTLAIIEESFKEIHIEENELICFGSEIKELHLFDNIADVRQPWKTVYNLSDLLLLVFLTIIMDKTTAFEDIAEYIVMRRKYYEKCNLIHDGKCPSHDTLRRVFSLIDPESLQSETLVRLHQLLDDLEPKKADRYNHLAVDGKEVRGSGRKEGTKNQQRNINILNIYDTGLYTCISSTPVKDKTNEIPTAQEILSKMNLKKKVITADALHCQRETCKVIHENKGIYVLTAKDNQQALKEDIEAKMERNKKSIKVYEREKRTFEIYHLPKSYAADGFTGLKSFIRMKSKIRKESITLHFISNSIDDELIIEAIENRWKIENDFHKEKDSFLHEDSFRCTDRITVQNIAIINNLATQLARIYTMVHGKDLRNAKRALHIDPYSAISSLLETLTSEEIINEVKKNIRRLSSAK